MTATHFIVTIIKKCVSAPRVFAIVFNIIKKFIHAYTVSKIRIYKSDSKKWQDAIKEYVDDDNLPMFLGGSMIDDDGNPRCPSKVSSSLGVRRESFPEIIW